MPRSNKINSSLVQAAKKLREHVDTLAFAEPVTHVYNPLSYAWAAHQDYLRHVPARSVEVVFLGMNPGPWGMAQTGVPFGEIAAVKEWMGIDRPVDQPDVVHPKRPIDGFHCQRSEVSGRRLWGLFQQWYPSADDFFRRHLVINYCPLVFMEASGKNRTPDKLSATEQLPLNQACDEHLCEVLAILRPKMAIGVGAYAETCLRRVWETAAARAGQSESDRFRLAEMRIGRILHPSPASPAANRDWAGTAARQLHNLGIAAPNS